MSDIKFSNHRNDFVTTTEIGGKSVAIGRESAAMAAIGGNSDNQQVVSNKSQLVCN